MKRSVLARKRIPVATMDPYRVVRRPHVSEKTTDLIQNHNTYVFKVDKAATKTDIREAISRIWNVTVKSIRIVNVSGKVKRMGRIAGSSPSWKKAIVKLAEGQGIDVLR
ncbi:MAG: 50S ribosomal protein L23 [Planctomycetota bacterium]|jgi:large subunit ribosomal protein L23|nr:50S ribosomal protein L23 [Planctomycetota bacterium]